MTLAIDIGGTKTLIAVLDNKGVVVRSLKFPTPVEYPNFLKELGGQTSKIIKKTSQGLDYCVVAVPGKLNRKEGVVVALGNLPWKQKPIAKDISKLTGLEVYIENDANLAALSEALRIPKYKRVLYITVSTGIGDGYIVNGVIDSSVADSEAGHMLLEHDGELKSWQSFASGKAIVERFGMRASDITNPSIWKTISHDIALGLIDLVAVLGPDAIIIGGGVGSHFDKFGAYLKAELRRYQSPVLVIPPVFQAKFPEEAVIYGCHALATQIADRATPSGV
jgi:predicted NBD/HSP70 family sugar kinase